MPELARTSKSVQQNIDSYWEGASGNFDLIKDAAKVRKWKCYRLSDGNWRCGPSRFVGYEGMHPEKYVMHKETPEGGLNGTETEYHLRQWTEDVREGSELHNKLYDVVENYLHVAGISVNRSARFSVLTHAPEDEGFEISDPNEDAMRALVTIAKLLPSTCRRALIRRLESIQEADT